MVAEVLVSFTSPTVPNTSDLFLIVRAYVRIGEADSVTEPRLEVNDENVTNALPLVRALVRK